MHPRLHGRGHWADHELPPIVAGTIIHVEVEHLPKPTARTNKSLWLWWTGPDTPDLDVCWRAYLRRFDIEHTFRFAKNTLGWTTPSICTPQQGERWTWLIIAALTQLRLARNRVADLHLPWERPRPTTKTHPSPSPTRVSTTSCTHRHSRQPTETLPSRTRPPQRHPNRAPTTPPSHQKDSRLRFNHKLSACRRW